MLVIGLMVAQISMARAMEPDENGPRNGSTSPVTTTSQNRKNVKGFSFRDMPQDIQISILDKWLDLKSIKHLNTAFTNKADRQQLIDTNKKFVSIDFIINTEFLFEQEDFNVYFAEKVMDQYNEFKGIRTLEIPEKRYNSSIHINKTIVQLLMAWIGGSSERAPILQCVTYVGGSIDFQTIKIDFFQNLRKVKLDS